MALAITVTRKLSHGGGIIFLFGTLTATGNYATNGDALDLSTIAGWNTKQPLLVAISGKAGFIYQYDYVNKKMLVYTNTAGGANAALGEHTAAAYVAGVTGDVITFLALIPKG